MMSTAEKSARLSRVTLRETFPETSAYSSAMAPSIIVVWLSSLVAALALVAAGIGVFWQAGDGLSTFTSLRGERVELYGEGLYRYDSLFAGAGNKGTDVVTLILGIPLLVVGTLLYRRGSLRGGLLMLSALTWFLYVYASYALGVVAYNDLFLVYVALFSASLFALVLAFRSFDVRTLPQHLTTGVPRRSPTIFLLASALVTLTVWLIALAIALITGEPPSGLDMHTTLFTNALDIAVIMPTIALAGWLILRRDALGYLMAFPLLVLEALLAPMIAAQTVSQLSAGVEFTTSEIVGPIAGFVTIAVIAFWMIVVLIRCISDTPLPPASVTSVTAATASGRQ